MIYTPTRFLKLMSMMNFPLSPMFHPCPSEQDVPFDHDFPFSIHLCEWDVEGRFSVGRAQKTDSVGPEVGLRQGPQAMQSSPQKRSDHSNQQSNNQVCFQLLVMTVNVDPNRR